MMEQEAKRQGQVGTAVTSLEKAIATVHELAAAVEERIEQILMPGLPSTECEKGEDRPQIVGLASQLDDLETRVAGATSRLRSVLDRCEL